MSTAQEDADFAAWLKAQAQFKAWAAAVAGIPAATGPTGPIISPTGMTAPSGTSGTAPPPTLPPTTTSLRPDRTNTGFQSHPTYPGVLEPMSPAAIQAGQTYRFKLFDAGLNGTYIGVPGVTFEGCQFAANPPSNSANYNVQVSAGSGSTSFKYCSVTPRPSVVTQPPGGWRWPSWGGPSGGGSGSSQDPNKGQVQIRNDQGFGYGLQMRNPGNIARPSGHIFLDHCDMWGFANAFDLHGCDINNQLTISNSWIHDPRYDTGPFGLDHTDGVGDIAGNNPGMSYVTIRNSVIAGIGNTQGIALQGPGPYDHWIVTDNYLCGFGYTFAITGQVSNFVFTDNVFGTDVSWDYGYLNGGEAPWHLTSNTWARNRLHVRPGTTRYTRESTGWTSAMDGWFCHPIAMWNNPIKQTDFVK